MISREYRKMLKLLQTIVHIEISGHHSSGFNLFVNKKHILEQIERILPSVKSKLNLKGFGGQDYGTLNHMAKIRFMSWSRFGTKSALRHMVARNRCTITPYGQNLRLRHRVAKIQYNTVHYKAKIRCTIWLRFVLRHMVAQ